MQIGRHGYSFTRILPRFIVGLFMAIILSVAGCTKQEQGGDLSVQPSASSSQLTMLKKYDVGTARIEFVIKGDFLPGTETHYFKDWGLHEAAISQAEGSLEKSITITDEKVSYSFGTSDDDGLKTQVDPVTLWRAGSGQKFTAFIDAMYIAQGYAKSGTATVAGRKCDVWQHSSMPIKLCIWKGVLLRMESQSEDGQKSIIEAVSIDENPKIPSDTFTVPSRVKFRSLI